MNGWIERQATSARRRIFFARFFFLASRFLFAGLLVATIAIVARAVWVIPVEGELWNWAWIGGTSFAALVAAGVGAWLAAPSRQEAAAEIDSRFGLKERMASALELAPSQRDTPMGRLLLEDAGRRAEPLDIRDRFAILPDRSVWLPLVPAAMLGLVLLLPPAASSDEEPAIDATLVSQTAQTKTAADALKRKIQQQRDRAEATGLKDAEDFFRKLEADLNRLTERPTVDQKEAMIALNDIKKKLDQRRDELGTPDQMRQAMAKMQDLERGPASDVVKAMQKGDFAEAEKQVKALADKLRDGKLNEQEQEELRKQIEAVRDQMNKAVERHEQAKRQLQEQIDQARREGRTEDAAKMQQQLNQLQAKDQQMQQMQQMCEGMNSAAQSLKDGKAGEAADALEQMADQLGDMQAEMDQLEDLEDTLDSLSQSKDQMRCQSCQGGGCEGCKGSGDGYNDGPPGDGLGAGQGFGSRPEQETETGTYDTQVRGTPKQGRGIIAGFADGPNRKGVSREEVKDAVLEAINEQSDPLENQNLPRLERDHTREYFNRLRGEPAG